MSFVVSLTLVHIFMKENLRMAMNLTLIKTCTLYMEKEELKTSDLEFPLAKGVDIRQ